MPSKDPSELRKLALSLLETPIHVIMENLEKRGKDITTAANDAEMQPKDFEMHTSTKSTGKGDRKGKARQMDTWTDRYKPKLFTELLGDEVKIHSTYPECPSRSLKLTASSLQRTHRQAMSWLKEWDLCVYKNGSSANAQRKKNLKRQRDANAPNGSTFGTVDKENVDPLGRPVDKVSAGQSLPLLAEQSKKAFIADPAFDGSTRAREDDAGSCDSSPSGIPSDGDQCFRR